MSVWYQRLQKLIQNLTSNPTESNTKWLAALHIWDLPHSLLSWVQVKFAGVMSMSYQSNKKMSLRFGAGSYYHPSIKTMYTNNAEHHTHLRFGAKQKVALAVFPHDTHLSMSFWVLLAAPQSATKRQELQPPGSKGTAFLCPTLVFQLFSLGWVPLLVTQQDILWVDCWLVPGVGVAETTKQSKQCLMMRFRSLVRIICSLGRVSRGRNDDDRGHRAMVT